MVDKIIFDKRKAVSVDVLFGDNKINYKTCREIILCGGAIASPQILQRSGVGSADFLAKFDIHNVIDLPGVGANLQDHLEVYMQYECLQPVSIVPALKWYNKPIIGTKWLFRGQGLGATNQYEGGGFIRTKDSELWPNIQYHFLPIAINYNGTNPIRVHSFQFHVGSMRSESRGRIAIRSTNPYQHPSIIFNYMSQQKDWEEFRDGIRITREIANQNALKAYRGVEISPGNSVQSDAEIDEFVKNKAETAFHPCGSCAMGYDDLAVVDNEGRIHGLESIRVVDASIMPKIITGNLNATTIMIAEKIADAILGTKLERENVDYYIANNTPARNNPN
jgi:choline dehydrogenase